VDNTLAAFMPQEGHAKERTVLLQSSSVFFWHSEQKNSYRGKIPPSLFPTVNHVISAYYIEPFKANYYSNLTGRVFFEPKNKTYQYQ